jgi:hypothetical protein
MPFFILVNHYWVREKPQAKAYHVYPDSYSDRKPNQGSQVEPIVPSYLAFPNIQMSIAITGILRSLRAL